MKRARLAAAGFFIILLLGSSCQTQVPPSSSQESIITASSQATQDTTISATPEDTLVPTSLKEPTPPWVIATPEPGKCNAWGQVWLVRWDNETDFPDSYEPMAGVEVEIGTGITIILSGGDSQLHQPVYRTTTDAEGFYLFTNIEPGGYVKRLRSYSLDLAKPGSWVYPDGEKTYSLSEIEAGQTVFLDTEVVIAKQEIELISPPAYGSLTGYRKVSGEDLNFQWQHYPNTDYYTLNIKQLMEGAVKVDMHLSTVNTSYTLAEILSPGEYWWWVTAYDSSDKQLAESHTRHFIVE